MAAPVCAIVKFQMPKGVSFARMFPPPNGVRQITRDIGGIIDRVTDHDGLIGGFDWAGQRVIAEFWKVTGNSGVKFTRKISRGIAITIREFCIFELRCSQL